MIARPEATRDGPGGPIGRMRSPRPVTVAPVEQPEPPNRPTVDDVGFRGRVVLRTVAWCVGVLAAGAGLLGALVVGFGLVVGPDAAHSDPAPDAAARDFALLATTDPAAALASCTPARGTDLDALSSTFTDGAVPAAQRYAVVDGPLTFVAARVTGVDTDGDRAVWVWGGGGWAAVTGDARAVSPVLPGPSVYGITAEAPGAQKAASCVDAAVRAGSTAADPTVGPVSPARTAPTTAD